MFKLWSTIKKDIRILLRDKVGLTLIFIMPILLAIVITAIQNNTFKLVNDNKVPLLLCNKDGGKTSLQFIAAIENSGAFNLLVESGKTPQKEIIGRMHAKDALLALIIPSGFSENINRRAKNISQKALKNLGLNTDSITDGSESTEPITLLYHPVLQESFRQSIQGSLRGALQSVESKLVIKNLYFSVNEKEIPATLENEMMNDRVAIHEVAVSRDGRGTIPNATQHNIPAWTIFAMFFIVISLGGSIVREKLNGSFIRLKTLPTNYFVALFSKQITYLVVCFTQAVVIFLIGMFLFPVMGLPKLDLPADLFALFLVTLICGWCAVSFAICIGVFAQTQEQANGFGAVSIILLAAIGGLLVPSFAMPASFSTVIKLSPLHWCLEAYYGLFLEGGKLSDILINILPLLCIIVVLQFITFSGLKRKHLI